MLKHAAIPLLLVAALASSSRSETVSLKYDTVLMDVAGKTFTMDIANDEPTINFGLMRRESLPADRGMVFIFAEPGKNGFWMKDCFIDLDIIWLDSKGKVVFIATMKAGDEVEQGGGVVAQYVLELNSGTAKQLGLKVGDTVAIPKKIIPIAPPANK